MKNKNQTIGNQSNQQATSPIAQLIRIGRQKHYVTANDVLKVIPHPENDVSYLEFVFAILTAINIPLVDNHK